MNTHETKDNTNNDHGAVDIKVQKSSNVQQDLHSEAQQGLGLQNSQSNYSRPLVYDYLPCRPSTHVAPLSGTEEHLCISTNITKEVDTEPPKVKPFVSGYDNVAYVPDVPAIEPQMFIIDDGCVQHGSQGTYIRYAYSGFRV